MMHARFFMLLFLLLAVSGHSVADSQVYIWQRVWNVGHETALRQSHDLFSTLRVLGLQIHPRKVRALPGSTHHYYSRMAARCGWWFASTVA